MVATCEFGGFLLNVWQIFARYARISWDLDSFLLLKCKLYVEVN